MPKVHTLNIVQDLTDLSASSNSLMQPCLLVPSKLKEDWFSLLIDVAEKIVESKNKTELKSVNLVVPSILSFLRPQTEKKSSSNSLQENVSRAHIHKFKQDSDIATEKLPNAAEHSDVSKSAIVVLKAVRIPEESCHQNTDPEADEAVVTDHDSKKTNKIKSINSSKETNKLSSTNNSDEASKMRSVESDAEASSSSVDDSGRICSSSEKAETKHSSTVVATKVSAGIRSKDVKENLSTATPKTEKLSVKDAVNLQSENNYEQTPKASKGSSKSSYLTQVLDKKFKSVCQNEPESVQVIDVKGSTSNSSDRNKKEGTSRKHLRREVLESNHATKATRVLKEDIPRKGNSQRSVITRNGSNNSLLASQKNVPSVIHPMYVKNMMVKASAQIARKEEEKLKELKMKEEKANENYKKLMTERQMRFEENKRKRQEKVEQAEQKRQMMEKEKELQLIKKYAKLEASSSAVKQTKTTEKRKYQEDVEETETKHRAKREREDVVKKFENHKINSDTPTEMNVTKVIQMAENRPDELPGKHPKQPLNAVNDTFVLPKATPPSAPLKSKLNEEQLKTPVNNTSSDEITSYEMTPIVNSDSEDESKRDRSKKIPAWAHGCLLKSALINQNLEARNPEEIFGSVIDSPNLEKIFCSKRNYSKRTSSRIWDSTILIEAN